MTLDKLRKRLISERDRIEAELERREGYGGPDPSPMNTERMKAIALAYNSVIIWTNER